MRKETTGLIRCLSDIGTTGVPNSRALVSTSLVGSQMSQARWPFAFSQLISRQVRYSCPAQLPLPLRSTALCHAERKCHSARTSDLIDLAARSGTLVRIGADGAACWSVSSGNGRCWRRITFGCVVTVTGLMQLIGEFVLGLLEFFDRLTKTASELR